MRSGRSLHVRRSRFGSSPRVPPPGGDNPPVLAETARALVAAGKGLPAADESGRPSEYAVWTNAHALARYAALAQEAGLVPIVEPEVLMDGTHTIEEAYHVTARVQHAVFTELRDQRVEFEGMLLKPNMVLAGYDAPQQASPD